MNRDLILYWYVSTQAATKSRNVCTSSSSGSAHNLSVANNTLFLARIPQFATSHMHLKSRLTLDVELSSIAL